MDKLNNTLKSNVSILWNKMDEVNLTLQETVLNVDSLNNSLGIKLTYYLNCNEVSIIALESLVGSNGDKISAESETRYQQYQIWYIIAM